MTPDKQFDYELEELYNSDISSCFKDVIDDLICEAQDEQYLDKLINYHYNKDKE